MARRRRNRSEQRDAFQPSLDPDQGLPDGLTVPATFSPSVRSIPTGIEDRRTWRPDALAAIRIRASVAPARVQVARPGRSPRPGRAFSFFNPPVGLQFRAPRGVLICVRRKIRKQVLHALRKTGKGSGRRPRRRNAWSGVKC